MADPMTIGLDDVISKPSIVCYMVSRRKRSIQLLGIHLFYVQLPYIKLLLMNVLHFNFFNTLMSKICELILSFYKTMKIDLLQSSYREGQPILDFPKHMKIFHTIITHPRSFLATEYNNPCHILRTRVRYHPHTMFILGSFSDKVLNSVEKNDQKSTTKK